MSKIVTSTLPAAGIEESAHALRQTVAWQRANPPAQIDAAAFDYAAEDALLESLKPRHG